VYNTVILLKFQALRVDSSQRTNNIDRKKELFHTGAGHSISCSHCNIDRLQCNEYDLPCQLSIISSSPKDQRSWLLSWLWKIMWSATVCKFLISHMKVQWLT